MLSLSFIAFALKAVSLAYFSVRLRLRWHGSDQ
jgi:hypothetical protein